MKTRNSLNHPSALVAHLRSGTMAHSLLRWSPLQSCSTSSLCLVNSTLLALLCVFAQTTAAKTVAPVKLYVSTTGSDTADGSVNRPFATLNRARDELRELSAKILPAGATVIVRGGTYELESTFELESQDSGTRNAPVVYRPYNGEKVIFSGGRTINDCHSAKSGVISCVTKKLQLQELDELGFDDRMRGPLPPFEVFLDERRLQLTRWPNADPQAPGGNNWAQVTSAPKNSYNRFLYSGTPKLSLRSINEAVVHIWPSNDWFDQYVGIKKFDGKTFTLADLATYPIEAGRRFSILNAVETLDAPGEWYYSTATEELKIIPPQGSSQQRPIVSYLDTVISLHDTQHVRMEGFTVEHSRKTAVMVTGGLNNSFNDFVVRNTGGFGIRINGGAEHAIVDSEIHDTGEGGLVLKGGDRESLVASNHSAIGNNIHRIGRLIRVGRAALYLHGVGNYGKQNRIHHTPGMAVSIVGNDHLLESNDIYNACEESADCGAVYTGRDWTYHGNIIRYNRIHDIYGYGMKNQHTSADTFEYSTGHGAIGVYLDDAASGFKIFSNLFYRIPDRMIQIGGGRNNVVDNNIFVSSGGYAIWMDARWPGFSWKGAMMSRLKAVPYKNKVWSSRYPQLAEPMQNMQWPEGNQITRNIFLGESNPSSMVTGFKYAVPPNSLKIDNNVVWNSGKTVNIDYQKLDDGTGGLVDWIKWKETTGLDKHSMQVEPGFVDSLNGDFRLQRNSPARRLGIKEIPLPKAAKDYNAHQKSTPARPRAAISLRVE